MCLCFLIICSVTIFVYIVVTIFKKLFPLCVYNYILVRVNSLSKCNRNQANRSHANEMWLLSFVRSSVLHKTERQATNTVLLHLSGRVYTSDSKSCEVRNSGTVSLV